MTHHNISASTLARTAALALALTNQVLSAVGKPILPIESAQLEQLISSGLTVAAALASWWNNNSFTPEAIEPASSSRNAENAAAPRSGRPRGAASLLEKVIASEKDQAWEPLPVPLSRHFAKTTM